MRIPFKVKKAKNIPLDVFIYLPNEKRFFYVDDKDVEEKYTTLYFEPGCFPDPEISKKFKNNEIVIVIDVYFKKNKSQG